MRVGTGNRFGLLCLFADLRYDVRMEWGRCPLRHAKGTRIVAGMVFFLVIGCRGSAPSPTVSVGADPLLSGTSEPMLAQTLQADVRTTAQWVATLSLAPTVTDAPLPTLDQGNAVGTPPAQRTGPCPVPEGYMLHDRDRFCIAAPAAWVALNVDGGLAATLNTTPGQAISLRPDWATSTEVCHLMVYVAAEASATQHLATRHAEFSARPDLNSLSPVMLYSLGGLLIPGFTWSTGGGETGGIYADVLGANRLIHISAGGTRCPLDQLIPALETLRADPD